jgi:acyl CoA:acetate/3-ketoacid CoA transferase alpha subunit
MVLLRAILRRGVKDLNVVGSAHGIDIGLLSGGNAISRSSESYVGFEQDFGMAPITGERSNLALSKPTIAVAVRRKPLCLSLPSMACLF